MSRAAGVVSYVPPDMAPGQVYQVSVFPRTTLGGRSLEDWLLGAIGGDPSPPGPASGPPTVSVRRDRAIVAVRTFTAGGQTVTCAYTGVRGVGDAARMLRVAWTGRLYDKYKGEMLPIAAAVGRALELAATVPTPPGAGVKPSQIAGVYAEQTNQMGTGGYFYLAFQPILALKDGTYCDDFDVPPSEFDVAASRRRPEHWGRWRFNAAVGGGRWNGSVQHIQTLSRKGVWETSDWIGPLSGGGPGQRLSGTYSHTGGSGDAAFGGVTTAVQQDSYTFSPDGRFRSGRDVAASIVPGTYTSHRTTEGTYSLSDYVLTLRFNDGAVRRWFYARVEEGMIFIQGYPYTTENGK